MNVFLNTDSGIFVTTSKKSEITISEKIISAACHKISISDKPLLFDNWVNTVNKIPEQVSIYEKCGSENYSNQSDISKQCISPKNNQNITVELRSAIKKSIGKLPVLESFKCLIIAMSKDSNILIAISNFTIKEKTYTYSLAETIINYSNPEISKIIDKLFNNFKPLGAAPYYICV
ncbi:MAG: hypothetical protein ABF289_19405 [Clostridiales bacterium]